MEFCLQVPTVDVVPVILSKLTRPVDVVTVLPCQWWPQLTPTSFPAATAVLPPPPMVMSFEVAACCPQRYPPVASPSHRRHSVVVPVMAAVDATTSFPAATTVPVMAAVDAS